MTSPRRGEGRGEGEGSPASFRGGRGPGGGGGGACACPHPCPQARGLLQHLRPLSQRGTATGVPGGRRTVVSRPLRGHLTPPLHASAPSRSGHGRHNGCPRPLKRTFPPALTAAWCFFPPSKRRLWQRVFSLLRGYWPEMEGFCAKWGWQLCAPRGGCGESRQETTRLESSRGLFVLWESL